jgi:peptidyl-prolyl cis-trans isomerase B (cyclophilin B)
MKAKRYKIMVRIEMETGGIIDIELYEDKAPITVANFKKLVSQGFYDGLIFHRVIAGFMIQGGDPTGTGCGGSSEKIKGEFRANGVANDISHVRGVVSMARSQMPNSASSQFFIMHADGKFLDGNYAAFGKVVSGIEVVDEIAGVKTNFQDRPVIDMRMKKVTLIEE